MFRRRGGYRRIATRGTIATDVDEGYRDSGARSIGSSNDDDRSRYASEISSSLSLQIMLYYNGLLSAVYFVLEGGLVVEKVTPLSAVRYVNMRVQRACSIPGSTRNSYTIQNGKK